jgi:hypothetical protein
MLTDGFKFEAVNSQDIEKSFVIILDDGIFPSVARSAAVRNRPQLPVNADNLIPQHMALCVKYYESVRPEVQTWLARSLGVLRRDKGGQC